MKAFGKAGILMGVLAAVVAQAEPGPEEAMEKPWESKLFTPYDDVDHTDEGEALKKRWKHCGSMAMHTDMVAQTVASVKRNPDGFYVSDEQNRDQLRQVYSQDNGNFKDELNKKTLELGFEHWDMANEDSSVSIELAQMAWDWCSKQDPEKFVDVPF